MRPYLHSARSRLSDTLPLANIMLKLTIIKLEEEPRINDSTRLEINAARFAEAGAKEHLFSKVHVMRTAYILVGLATQMKIISIRISRCRVEREFEIV